ncbi:uncharacterized protein LOC144579140 isoform X2 [Callithrix jacchus]
MRRGGGGGLDSPAPCRRASPPPRAGLPAGGITAQAHLHPLLELRPRPAGFCSRRRSCSLSRLGFRRMWPGGLVGGRGAAHARSDMFSPNVWAPARFRSCCGGHG